jgi:betaine-aldehyde dehydrogenase
MPSFGLQRLYIGGEYVDASSGTTFDTFNPATGEKLATVQQASAADIDRSAQMGSADRDATLAHSAPRGGTATRAQRRTRPA